MSPDERNQSATMFNRRDFIRVLAAGSGGLVLAAWFGEVPAGPARHGVVAAAAPAQDTLFTPNIFLTIEPSGAVIITVQRSEMGQGVRTALAMCLADELDVAWGTVRIEQAEGDSAYGDQTTGGSASISGSAWLFRAMGAKARQVLIAAAAQGWKVDPAGCTTAAGSVVHPDGKQHMTYGDLVEAAAGIDAKSLGRPDLKPAGAWTLLGTRMGHWDAPAMVTGEATYGLDVRLPGMKYAVIARSPVMKGALVRFDDAKVRLVPGVLDVVPIDSGVAVVAENSWAAIEGRKALKAEWDEGAYGGTSTADIHQGLVEGLPKPGEAGPGAIEAYYDVPYEAHIPMEPMNCTADVREDGCDVWAPSQNPQDAKWQVVRATGLPAQAVHLHVPLIGGGFGRRLQSDFAHEAAQLSKAIGAPVQILWTRDDDIQHDFYHPMSSYYASAAPAEPFPQRTMRSRVATNYLPTGAWRSVENFPDAFVRECFLDEYAAAAEQDPLALRIALCGDEYAADARPVIELAAEKAGWGKPLPEGWGRGIAFHSTFGVTHVAQVAEVEVDPRGNVRVHRVVCAVDCGMVVNPSAVEAQMEGGIVFGLTAALKDAITVKNGRVEQRSFKDFGMLRMDEMPAIEVYIVPSDRQPTGIGEMGVPPAVPALLNAIYAATGARVRSLPVRL